MQTIALVDDDRNILTSVIHRARSQGFPDQHLHRRGFRARRLPDQVADLAVLDIKMPRMDGMETLRRLRQKSDLPVIFLTSKEEEIDEFVRPKNGGR